LVSFSRLFDSILYLADNRVDLITSFVTFHHVSQLKETLTELARILRPGGYLILREHDCTNKHLLSAKYLNFVHAIMMIGGVGEFANSSSNPINKNQHVSSDHENDKNAWTKQKSWIIEYTKSIHYRTCDEWQQELGSVGFHLHATLYYGANGSDNPQKLFYAVYQLDKR
jgi:ubiquinone/menaquinone biosynthesis C-methylase UbiE